MKRILLILLPFICLLSCTEGGGGLTLSDPEDIKAIEKIMDENFGVESEVFKITLSAPTLSDRLNDISREYKFKDVYFRDTYYVSENKFRDPQKQPKIIFKKTKSFKIKDLDLSIIPIKYNEALTILREKNLLAEDDKLPLSSWTFKKDRQGNICSDFNLDYFIGRQRNGRMETTTYDDFDFEVDKNNKLIFKE